MGPLTSHDDVLRELWYCEHCHTEYQGADPPVECDVCGHVLFENGYDVVVEGRPLPVPTRSATLTDGAVGKP